MTTARPKLVLHVAPTPFFADRGCHIRIEGIVRSLKQLGWESLVCTYHHGHDVAGVTTKRITPIPAYTQTSAGPNPWKLWADLKLLGLVFKQVKQHHPAVLHAHLHEGLFIALLIKWLFFWRGIPVVADLQGSFTGELDSHGVFKRVPFLRGVSRLCERVLMWFPTHIVCSSERSLSLFSEQFSISTARMSLAQDGADEAQPLSDEQRTALRQDHGIPTTMPVLVYSGALLQAKGLVQLQELIQAAKARDTAVHFLIIGYPTNELSDYLKHNKLEHRCTLLGQVAFDQLQPLLSCADMAIDPKNFDAGEGSGKMLNYMACGLPVLAFNTQNNRSFLPANSELANSVIDLSLQLDKWSNDAPLRERIGHQNREFFKAHYSWNITRDQLQKTYALLFKGKH